jgi:hypothetical protein
MKNLSMLTPIFFLFCLLSHVISSVSTSTPRYTAADNIAINCGTRDNSTAMDKRQWVGDIHSKFTPIEEGDHKSNASTPQIQDSSVNTVPYKTARLSYSQFMYEFHVTPGPKFVRFYFYPVSYSGFEGSHHDFFTVKANSFTLLSNFSASIYIHADSLKEDKTLSKEFCINVEKDQILNLTFIPSPSTTSSKFYAFVNGIEIVSMPEKLYYGEKVQTSLNTSAKLPRSP